ncbi:hypothetical protein [Kribbella qitaiheensis]|nr:hypothetical protein [Kribbella qitaiheensis]
MRASRSAAALVLCRSELIGWGRAILATGFYCRCYLGTGQAVVPMAA